MFWYRIRLTAPQGRIVVVVQESHGTGYKPIYQPVLHDGPLCCQQHCSSTRVVPHWSVPYSTTAVCSNAREKTISLSTIPPLRLLSQTSRPPSFTVNSLLLQRVGGTSPPDSRPSLNSETPVFALTTSKVPFPFALIASCVCVFPGF